LVDTVPDILLARSARVRLPARSWRKRALDLTISGAALALFLPLLCVIALAIWLDGGGPIFFRQQRTGLYGRPFTILKFRTMRVHHDPGATQARRGDPRITRVGRILRKLSFDELPQLINVLKGDMSLVGPRPHAMCHDAEWSRRIADYRKRFDTRPGLTGLAQVRGFRGEIHDDEGLRKRIAADREYIETWSFTSDLALLLKTAPLVLADANAY